MVHIVQLEPLLANKLLLIPLIDSSPITVLVIVLVSILVQELAPNYIKLVKTYLVCC